MRVRIEKTWSFKRACRVCGDKVTDEYVLTYYDGRRYVFFHIGCLKDIIDKFYGEQYAKGS